MIKKIFTSMIKGVRLNSFQKKYIKFSQNQKLDTDFLNSIATGSKKKDLLIIAYIEFCLLDPNIKEICKVYGLSQIDLSNLLSKLEMGLGHQYIKGHYVFMSTLAYPEPLEYTVVKIKEDESIVNICETLKKYWSEDVAFGALFNSIKNSNQFIKRNRK